MYFMEEEEELSFPSLGGRGIVLAHDYWLLRDNFEVWEMILLDDLSSLFETFSAT